MRKVIKHDDPTLCIAVENGDEDQSIGLTQWEDFVMMMNERQARKVVKAIRKAAKELGWKV